MASDERSNQMVAPGHPRHHHPNGMKPLGPVRDVLPYERTPASIILITPVADISRKSALLVSVGVPMRVGVVPNRADARCCLIRPSGGVMTRALIGSFAAVWRPDSASIRP
jgi:hypothetical protein